MSSRIMTRINVIRPEFLLDQHLMAEYRELPMIEGSLKRSLVAAKDNKIKNIPKTYRLEKGHMKFFYNKKQYLYLRYLDIIEELYARGYNIQPADRSSSFETFSNIEQIDWEPTLEDLELNLERIVLRFDKKPDWYKFKGKSVPYYKEALDFFCNDSLLGKEILLYKNIVYDLNAPKNQKYGRIRSFDPYDYKKEKINRNVNIENNQRLSG